jgi:hypothetical protein
VRNDGQLHYRDGGEAHLNTPAGMANLQVRHSQIFSYHRLQCARICSPDIHCSMFSFRFFCSRSLLEPTLVKHTKRIPKPLTTRTRT